MEYSNNEKHAERKVKEDILQKARILKSVENVLSEIQKIKPSDNDNDNTAYFEAIYKKYIGTFTAEHKTAFNKYFTQNPIQLEQFKKFATTWGPWKRGLAIGVGVLGPLASIAAILGSEHSTLFDNNFTPTDKNLVIICSILLVIALVMAFIIANKTPNKKEFQQILEDAKAGAEEIVKDNPADKPIEEKDKSEKKDEEKMKNDSNDTQTPPQTQTVPTQTPPQTQTGSNVQNGFGNSGWDNGQTERARLDNLESKARMDHLAFESKARMDNHAAIAIARLDRLSCYNRCCYGYSNQNSKNRGISDDEYDDDDLSTDAGHDDDSKSISSNDPRRLDTNNINDNTSIISGAEFTERNLKQYNNQLKKAPAKRKGDKDNPFIRVPIKPGEETIFHGHEVPPRR